MKHFIKILTILITLTVANTAFALDCNRNDLDQTTMNKCANLAWQAADADLNRAYKQAKSATKQMDGYTPAGEKPATILLRDAQRTWIKYRDQACAAESVPMRGGSAQALLFWGCMERLTRDRTYGLKILAQIGG